MNRRLVAAGAAVLLAAGVTAATTLPAATNLPAATSAATASADDSTWLRPLIEQAPAAVRAARFTTPPTTAQCLSTLGAACYSPAQIQAAYGTTGLLAKGDTGAGQTICIVDSFGSPTIAHDVDVFSDNYGLPEPKLTIVAPAGKVPAYNDSSDRAGWAGETSLDVEWSHALAPDAAIVLVETPTSETEGIHGFPEMARALAWTAAHEPCDVVSQSYSATEPTFTSPSVVLKLRNQMFKQAVAKDITLLASAGDAGATDSTLDENSLYPYKVNSWPSADPLVTSIGGTRLRLDRSGKRLAPDSAWGGTPGDDAGGGGLSAIFARPGYQNRVKNVVGTRRGTPDISLDADPMSSLVTYESFGGGNDSWHIEAGTSAASPMFAGIVALATQAAGHKLGQLNPLLYGPLTSHGTAVAHGIIDVTHGSNDVVDHFNADGTTVSLRGYKAVRGYDLATGLGTVDAGRLVPALVAASK